MIQRRDQAWPDTFCWTWIQTEPAPMLMDLARQMESPPILEPEQIRLQVYAALAAGCRGLGYWTTTPLDHDSPAARERLLAITHLNLELELLSPWITSRGTPQMVSFRVDEARSNLPVNLDKPVRTKPVKPLKSSTVASAPPPRKAPKELQAAMFRSENGLLLLPMWLEENAQFVPGQMAARNVSIIVPGAGETAAAWEITTTGQLRHLNREPAVGGVQIQLKQFDQTAAILITSNQASVEDLNQKVLSIQEQSARVSVELAKLKLERIRQVDRSLQSLGVARPDAPLWLGEAKIALDRAESELRKHQYAEARLAAGEAMQLGRHLQRTHWEYATRRLPNPTPVRVAFLSDVTTSLAADSTTRTIWFA